MISQQIKCRRDENPDSVFFKSDIKEFFQNIKNSILLRDYFLFCFGNYSKLFKVTKTFNEFIIYLCLYSHVISLVLFLLNETLFFKFLNLNF